MPISQTFLQARITATETAIAAYEVAQLAFANNGAMLTYKLNTGQSDQSVTRADVTTTLQSLYNQLSTLYARKDGASSIGRPIW